MKWAFLFVVLLGAERAMADAIDRMSMANLRATHEQAQEYQAAVQAVERQTGYQDIRAILHAHSYWSHDSIGTIKEIVAAAQATGVKVVMFSNHPADTYDFFEDTEGGMHDGVLLIPGAETGGLLVYPTRSMKGHSVKVPQAFVDLLNQDGGLSFVCHLEERLDWNLDRLTGNEIYNTHADLMDETRFLTRFKEPMSLMQLLPALQQYPQATFAAIQDYPADYLQVWDRWCQRSPHTGIAANDSHHNQAYRAFVTENRKLRVEDALGKELAVVDPERIPAVKLLIGKAQPGAKILEIDLDPYDRSFRHVSTHLLMTDLTRQSVWDALQAGRAYVAFDWMADPSGFVFQATTGIGDSTPIPMGSQSTIQPGMALQAEAPLTVDWKLLRNGKVISESTHRVFDHKVTEPGVYRIEAWLSFVGEPRPWILSNPIYVRANDS